MLIGDVDCSGDVNSQDASLILQFVTNIIDELPCQENMTGLTPEQLQEIINMMDEQLSISYSGGGSNNYPVMISGISSESMHFGNALIYCADLEEDGYSDWFLPNLDQLAYAVSGGCELPDERSSSFLWTTSKSHYNNWNNEIVLLNESTSEGMIAYGGDNSFTYCRCARFGEGGTGDGSSGSSNSSGSGSSLSGGSEQSITMIGPTYTPDDFPEFEHYYNTYTSVTQNIPDFETSYVYYLDAIRFCSQLEYNDYDDWFLPSYSQIENYFINNTNANFIIPNQSLASVSYWLRFKPLGASQYGAQSFTLEVTGPSNEIMTNQAVFLDSGTFSDTGTYRCFCVR